VTQSPSDEPTREPAEEGAGQPDQPPDDAGPPDPSFGRSLGTLWTYTILRFLVFGVLFGLLWLVSVPVFLAAVLALVLSVPLSYVVLARPRAALAQTVEARVATRQAHNEDLSSRLKGDDGEASPDPS
jgi:hypothetical protein